MRVTSSHTGALTAAASTAKPAAPATSDKKSGGTSFAASLKGAAATATAANAEKAPATEKTTPVAGHLYADITAGPRSGMFLNTSHNARKDEVFVMVKRAGKEYHVYGTGKNREVVCLAPKSAAAAPTTPTTTTPTTTTPSTGDTSTGSSVVGS
jgi:hypothetical protein